MCVFKVFAGFMSDDSLLYKELISWEVPYNDISDARVPDVISKGILPAKPMPEDRGDVAMFEQLWVLCNLCWSESTLRPSAGRCIEYLVTRGNNSESILVYFVEFG